ncbi:MAG: 16S rRNA (cytosine(1402)-N(4))-methyltransferase RsmH [Verrucomicrobia bacterium]|nr:16S rRNA (cytosine(1402)-N(4))-methyltransferase RsmH [Verrucomicrobiota bacterium]
MTDLIHKPVMVAEVLAALQPKPGGRYADGTVGLAGHASAILTASAPNGFLFGCDRDGVALEAAAARLVPFAGRFELRRMNFAELAGWVGAGTCDGILLDLGVSSVQLDTAARGFSFQQDGPLDMRMDDRTPVTAATICNTASAEELAKLFEDYGDEPHARRIARAIERDRQVRPFTTTRQLAELIERLNPRRGSKTHPATRVFQALRIAVNDEIASVRRGLSGAFGALKPGGRMAVITFHSLEDRVVKWFGRDAALDYTVPGGVDVPELRQPRMPLMRVLTRKPVQPGGAEVAENPRARSAQLRVFEKI